MSKPLCICLECGAPFRQMEQRFVICLDCRDELREVEPWPDLVDCFSQQEGYRIEVGFRMMAGEG